MMASGKFGVALLALVLAGAASAEAVRVSDIHGRETVLPRPAQRIVALAPNLTELVFAAGAGERLVGVSAYSDYPAAARKLPQVGSYGKADRERLLQLRPDLIVAWRGGNSAGDIAFLEKLGIPLYITETRRLDDIPQHIEAIGQLAGSAPQAQRAAATFRRELDEIEKRYSNAQPVGVFYQIWHRPLMTVNGQHPLGEVIRLCGGINPYAGLSVLTPVVSLESLLAANPAVIVVNGKPDYWRRYPQLEAVRRNRLYTIDPDLLLRTTPRLLEGARQLCAVLEQARQQP